MKLAEQARLLIVLAEGVLTETKKTSLTAITSFVNLMEQLLTSPSLDCAPNNNAEIVIIRRIHAGAASGMLSDLRRAAELALATIVSSDILVDAHNKVFSINDPPIYAGEIVIRHDKPFQPRLSHYSASEIESLKSVAAIAKYLCKGKAIESLSADAIQRLTAQSERASRERSPDDAWSDAFNLRRAAKSPGRVQMKFLVRASHIVQTHLASMNADGLTESILSCASEKLQKRIRYRIRKSSKNADNSTRANEWSPVFCKLLANNAINRYRKRVAND